MTNKEFLCGVHLFIRNECMSLHAYPLKWHQSPISLIFIYLFSKSDGNSNEGEVMVTIKDEHP